MFTGIVEEVGRVREVRNLGGRLRLTIEAPRSLAQLKVSDSVAINGVCQTVVECGASTFSVEAVEETLAKTTLGDLVPGMGVNLELAMRLGERMGGHLVQGHVDGVGMVQLVQPKTNSWILEIAIPDRFMKYVIPVGSIAVDGISLTVASVHGSVIEVSIIPHTMENTTLGDSRAGSRVNLEFDVIGTSRGTLASRKEVMGGSITTEKLRAWGTKGSDSIARCSLISQKSLFLFIICFSFGKYCLCLIHDCNGSCCCCSSDRFYSDAG